MTDARRREVYWARYADGARVEGPAVDRPSELADRWPGGTRLAGPGAAAYRETLERYAVEDRAPYPSAASIAQLGATRAWTEAPGEPLTPLYLRRPDAAMPRDATAVLGP
jgi:tRNA A37 threonylcarbamoyladenosine modification protein TsaB